MGQQLVAVVDDEEFARAAVPGFDEAVKLVEGEVEGHRALEALALIDRRRHRHHQPLAGLVNIGFGPEALALGVLFRQAAEEEFLLLQLLAVLELLGHRPGVDVDEAAGRGVVDPGGAGQHPGNGVEAGVEAERHLHFRAEGGVGLAGGSGEVADQLRRVGRRHMVEGEEALAGPGDEADIERARRLRRRGMGEEPVLGLVVEVVHGVGAGLEDEVERQGALVQPGFQLPPRRLVRLIDLNPEQPAGDHQHADESGAHDTVVAAEEIGGEAVHGSGPPGMMRREEYRSRPPSPR